MPPRSNCLISKLKMTLTDSAFLLCLREEVYNPPLSMVFSAWTEVAIHRPDVAGYVVREAFSGNIGRLGKGQGMISQGNIA
jgi:hypothetical protein